jgi:hypothetical protein
VADVLQMPVKVSGDTVVTFEDVAVARRTFKDPAGYARVNGQPAVALEVSKRIGTNIIDVVQEVREVVERERAIWPEGIQASFSQDKSDDVRNLLFDLRQTSLKSSQMDMYRVIDVVSTIVDLKEQLGEKIAHVVPDSKDRVEHAKDIGSVAMIRGLNYKVFTDIDLAWKWLQE